MAVLDGYSQGPTFIAGPQGTTVNGRSAGTVSSGSPNASMAAVIDGTPIRVVVLALSAAAGLTALHWAGFRFSIGVSA